MPIPSDTPVALTARADRLVMFSQGRNASDEAVAAGRIAVYLDDRRTEWAAIGPLMRTCEVAPSVMAELLRTGACVLMVPDVQRGCCERCGQPSPHRALCDHCMSEMGAGPKPYLAREPVRLVAKPFGKPEAKETRRRLGMRSRRRDD